MFRSALAGDEDALTQLERAANLVALAHIFPPEQFGYPTDEVHDRWHRLVRDPAVQVAVVDGEDGLTALVAVDSDLLRHLAVRPDQWGRGLAGAALAWAVEHGPVRRLWCLEDNGRALGLYAHLGWSPTGRRQRAEFPPYPDEIELALGVGDRQANHEA